MIKADETLDTVGTFCPMPIILTQKKVKELKTGAILEVLSDDEGIAGDMPVWCENNGHEFLEIIKEEDIYKAYIKKR